MSQAANNYGQALFELAKEENLDAVILKQMEVLNISFSQEPGFLRLLAAPNLSKSERCDILDESFRGKVEPYLLNFMKILMEKGYIRLFPDCFKAYRNAYNAEHGILCVKAVSAVELSAAQKEKLTKKLESITGKTIQLENRLDPKVLGGIRLDYDGIQVDGTVQSRLDAVADLLKNTVL